MIHPVLFLENGEKIMFKSRYIHFDFDYTGLNKMLKIKSGKA